MFQKSEARKYIPHLNQRGVSNPQTSVEEVNDSQDLHLDAGVVVNKPIINSSNAADVVFF